MARVISCFLLLAFFGLIPCSTHAKNKTQQTQKKASEPDSQPHYFMMGPEPAPENSHGRVGTTPPDPENAPPSISSPDRFMKAKPERDKSDLNQ